ncbi:MAG TPA: 3-methyl-2-oxobutanoate dehydrogenase subunit beta [Ruminococcaceae bacterium]|nr:3-methyl-2-oxobutanoate dehydrogenase subunit beta [Oscillospiraceae bacterium]
MAEKVLMKGNEALAEAAISAGCRHFFGYPITPQTEISAYMAKHMPKAGGTYLQAESELAAINMVYGAACAGVRAMTSSSSPGISLKSEGISYLAACDLPCLIVNVQRGGPGLGGIQPSQSDYWQATKAAGHGDFFLLVLAPASVQEMIDDVFLAYELSEKYRIPAMILSDGMLGQMMEPVILKKPKAEKSFSADSWATNGHEGKRAHHIINSLYLQADTLEKLNNKRFKRYEVVIHNEQRAEKFLTDDADLIIAAYGAAARIAKTAVIEARAKGYKVGLLRPITLWPFPKEAFVQAAKTAKAFLSVELNMGQMVDDVKLAISCQRPVHFFGRAGGAIPTPAQVFAQVERILGGAEK